MSKNLLVVAIIAVSIAYPQILKGGYQEGATPYIYYYSQIENGLRIESADGQTSRLITLENNDSAEIFGPGWSPSGKWFTWYTNNHESMSSAAQIELLHRDGSRKSLSLDSEGTIFHLQWSPHEDYLSVGILGSVDTSFSIIDADTGQVVAQHNLGGLYTSVMSMWEPAGRRIAIQHSNQSEAYITFLALDGTAIQKSTMVHSKSCLLSTANWSSDGMIAYQDMAGQLVLYDSDADSPIFVEDILGSIAFIDWNPNAEFALIYTYDSRETGRENSYSLSLLDVESESIETVSESTLLPFFWPENITTWNPQYDTAWYIASDGTLNTFTLFSMEDKRIELPTEGVISSFRSVQWSNNNSVLVFIWQTRNFPIIYFYNTVDDTILYSLGTSETYGHTFALSNTGENLAFFGACNGEVDVVCIMDITTKAIDYLAPHTLLIENYSTSAPSGRLIWHPDQNWLFVVDVLFDRQSLLQIVDVETLSQREIGGYITFSNSYFGWLPDLVE